MSIQLTRYFRVLVIGEENKFVGDIIEKDLVFRVRLVPQDQIEDAIRGSADCGAIVVSRDHVEDVVKTCEERGLRMPIFLISRRREETFLAPYLKSLHGVVIADLESRDFYEKRLKA